MTVYEKLEDEAYSLGIYVNNKILQPADNLDGLYIGWQTGSIILINKHRSLAVQTIALAEEIGHHHRSIGQSANHTDYLSNRSERVGRIWSYKRLMPVDKLFLAIKKGVVTTDTIAEHFEVTENFVTDAINYYSTTGMSPVLMHGCIVA